MSAIDPQTLFEESKCYLCYGVSQAEAFQLALLSRIAGGGCLVYRALLTQSGTDAPVATVLENTIGNIVWTRSSEGLYLGTLAGAFTAGRTWLSPALSSFFGITFDGGSFVFARNDSNTVQIYVGAAEADQIITDTPIEIMVCP